MADETQQPENTPASSWPADPAAPAQEASSIPVEPGPATPPASEPADPSPAETAAPVPPASGGEVPAAEAPAPVASPVLVNNFTRRDDNDALLGHWVDVIAGEFEGRFGAYEDDVSHDPQTGYPDRVLVRTRDAENELIQVAYSDIRPSKRTGGR